MGLAPPRQSGAGRLGPDQRPETERPADRQRRVGRLSVSLRAAQSPMKSVREVLAQIKALIDCRAVAQELNLPHRWGSFLCPFHDDHKPSMSVRATGFKCWACGATGDAIKLVAQVRKVNFRDALAYLAS